MGSPTAPIRTNAFLMKGLRRREGAERRRALRRGGALPRSRVRRRGDRIGIAADAGAASGADSASPAGLAARSLCSGNKNRARTLGFWAGVTTRGLYTLAIML